MKRRLKYLLFALVCIFVTPLMTHAKCDYQRQAELSRIASNVQISYTAKIVNNSPEYTVNILNVPNDIYIVDSAGNKFASQSEFVHKYFIWDNKVSFTIYSNDNNCKGESILTKSVSFPHYNQYSSLPECQQHADLNLCSLWYNTSSYSQNEFLTALNKASNVKTISEVKEEKGWTDVFKGIIHDNFIYVVLSVICVIILSVIIVVRKVRV